jgi:hypothetical protein
VLLESLRTAELLVALITLVQRGMSRGVEVLVERLLAAKGLVAFIAIVYLSGNDLFERQAFVSNLNKTLSV